MKTAYPYLSTYQIAAAQTDTGRDGHIQISGTVTDSMGTPLPGMQASAIFLPFFSDPL